MTMTIESNPSSAIDRNAVFERKRAVRIAAIEQLLQDQQADGSKPDRFIAMLKYDSELAPISTNQRQLAEIGIHPPPPDSLCEEDIATALKLLIDGLAELGLFLCETNHLPDRRLYTVLCTQILHEEIRDIPPCDDMSEFIDLSLMPPSENLGRVNGQSVHSYPPVCDRDSTMPRPKAHRQSV